MVKIVGQNEIKKDEKWILLLISDNYYYDRKLLEVASRKYGCIYRKCMAINEDESIISFHFSKEGGYKRFKKGISKSSLYNNRLRL